MPIIIKCFYENVIKYQHLPNLLRGMKFDECLDCPDRRYLYLAANASHNADDRASRASMELALSKDQNQYGKAPPEVHQLCLWIYGACNKDRERRGLYQGFHLG